MSIHYEKQNRTAHEAPIKAFAFHIQHGYGDSRYTEKLKQKLIDYGDDLKFLLRVGRNESEI